MAPGRTPYGPGEDGHGHIDERQQQGGAPQDQGHRQGQQQRRQPHAQQDRPDPRRSRVPKSCAAGEPACRYGRLPPPSPMRAGKANRTCRPPARRQMLPQSTSARSSARRRVRQSWPGPNAPPARMPATPAHSAAGRHGERFIQSCALKSPVPMSVRAAEVAWRARRRAASPVRQLVETVSAAVESLVVVIGDQKPGCRARAAARSKDYTRHAQSSSA